jgi:hypothetical protein
MSVKPMVKAFNRASVPGVNERPPMPGFSYVAFAVHEDSGPLKGFAIAHKNGEKFVVDVVRQGITVDESAELMKRYGIDTVTAAPHEGGDDAMAHAVAGAIVCLKRGSA